MAECICDWPEGCAGLGVLFCDGCGGDTCVCLCGGECFGCEECDGFDDEDYDDFGDEAEGGGQ